MAKKKKKGAKKRAARKVKIVEVIPLAPDKQIVKMEVEVVALPELGPFSLPAEPIDLETSVYEKETPEHHWWTWLKELF